MAKTCVLIVEDDGFQRTVTRHALQAAGYEVTEAADGTEGLAKAERLWTIWRSRSSFIWCSTCRR